jgi:hypothetical protein
MDFVSGTQQVSRKPGKFRGRSPPFSNLCASLQTRVKVTFTAAARQNLGFQYTWATWTGYKYRQWSWTALAFTYLNSSLSSRFLQGCGQGQPEPPMRQTAAVCQNRGRKAWNQGKTSPVVEDLELGSRGNLASELGGVMPTSPVCQ